MFQERPHLRAALAHIALAVFFVFLGFVLLSPNPYGNNPDVIADESYFLTSSLSAIQKHTLPGWEFSASGNYYGGPQTYLDTVVLVPVVGVIMATHHFSISATEGYAATHTGELLHVVRLVNGALALAVIAGLCWLFRRRKIPAALARMLVLYLFLLLSNALLVQLLHTAKVWDVYVIIVSAVSALFLAQQYYRQRLSQEFFSKDVWVGILVWSGITVLFQNYVGAFSIALVAGYAWYLGQVTIRDFWNYVWRYWHLILLAGLTQISFLYRAVFINWLDGSFSNISVKTAGDQIVWMLRVVNPVLYAILGDPLTLLFGIGLAALGVWGWRNRASFKALLLAAEDRRMLAVALAHPLIAYVFFGIIVGFDSAPRYGIILSTACAFSTVLLANMLERWWGQAVTYSLILLSGLLFLIVGAQAIHLYWQPSSEVQLLRSIEARHGSSHDLFLVEPSALRLTLPINEASLALLDAKRADFGRFAFLRAHPEAIAQNISFAPRTLTAYSPEEEARAIKELKDATTTLWIISADCARRCTEAETAADACFEVHADACSAMLPAQEVNFLGPYLGAMQLGYPYVVRKAD